MDVYIWVLILIFNHRKLPVFVFTLVENLFERSLQNHQIPIQPASVCILYLILCLQYMSYNKEKRRFCKLACNHETFDMGLLFCFVFQRSNVMLKLANFCFVFWMLFYYFTHTDVRARSFWAYYFCLTTAMTVVTESSQISLSHWKCLDSLFSFSNSSLALAIYNFKPKDFLPFPVTGSPKEFFGQFLELL